MNQSRVWLVNLLLFSLVMGMVTGLVLRSSSPPAPKPITLEDKLARLEQVQQTRYAAHVKLLATAGQNKSKFLSSLRRKNLDAETVLASFQAPVAKDDDLFGLYQEYLRWTNAEADLAAFRGKQSGLVVEIEQIRTAVERVKTRSLANTGLNEADRQELDELLAGIEVEAQGSLSSAEDSLARQKATEAVRTAIQSHQSKLSPRPVLTADQLPALPELRYPGIDDSAEILLTRLREKILPDYKRSAIEQLANRRTEEALIALREGCEKAIQQIEAFPRPKNSRIAEREKTAPSSATWRREALKALRNSAKKVHDEIGRPYHEASKQAALDDNWNCVIDFLEELHDKAPQYSKLPDLLKMTREHLGQKEMLNDPEAAALASRFHAVMELQGFQWTKSDAPMTEEQMREQLDEALEKLKKEREEEGKRIRGESSEQGAYQTGDSAKQAIARSVVPRRTFQPGSVFFSEDFSKIAEGNLPTGWSGDSVLVRRNGRTNMLTTFSKQKAHKIHITDVEFPENFRLEWVLRTNPKDYEWAPVTYDMTVGSMTARLYMKYSDNPYANNSRAKVFLNKSESAVPYAGLGNSVVTLALEKNDATFKLFLNNQVVLIARDEKYQQGTGFNFTASTVHDDWSFGIARVIGKAQ